MRFGTYVRIYEAAVEAAYRERLAGLGYSLRKDRQHKALVAQSGTCRILFSPDEFILSVQRVTKPASVASPAYEMNVLLRAMGVDQEYSLPNSQNEALSLQAEVDRMVCLLLTECQPLLDGDEAAWQRVSKVACEVEDEAIDQLGEIGLKLKDGDRLRELPELESVRVKVANKVINTSLVLPLLAVPGVCTILLPIMMVWYVLDRTAESRAFVVPVLGVLVFLAIMVDRWIVRRLLLCDYYYATSRDGFTVGRFLGRLFVSWEDVESGLFLRRGGYEIRTSQRVIKLEESAAANACLEASIWQHLKRAGRAHVSPLSPLAVSLWAQIPDDTTDEIQWEPPDPPALTDIVLRALFWQALIWGPVLYFRLRITALPFIFASFPITSAAYSLSQTTRISISPDQMEATTALGSCRVGWNKVRSMRFLDGWSSHAASLMIRVGILRYVRIPWLPEHPNSTRLLLAIVKRLRQEERFQLQPFPAVLLSAAYDTAEED